MIVTNGVNDPSLLEVIDKVHSFYNDAWGELTWSITIGLFVVGIVVPWIIQRYQARIFKIEEQKIKDDLNKFVADLIEIKVKEQISAIEENIKENLNSQQIKFKAQFANTEALIFHSLGFSLNNLNPPNHYAATRSFLNALNCYVNCDDPYNLRICLEGLGLSLDKLKEKDISSLNDEGKDFKILDSIDDKYSDNSFRGLVLETKRKFKQASERNK